MSDHLHICPLCEATCGLRLTIEDGTVSHVRGDSDDVFSRGFVCPKGVAIGELHSDPDRVRTPMVRGPDGLLHPATWDEAFDVVRTRLGTVIAEHGPEAVAVFLGNPNVHNTASAFYLPALLRALGTSQRYSASTVDQFPKQVASALMFGTPLTVAVPDIDRTDYLLVLGANPLVSNGSMMTAPDMPGRLRDLRARGGRLVVVDPVRTRTARAADEHIAIRPGGDALLLAALAHVLMADGLADPGAAGAHLAEGALDVLADGLRPFSPEVVSPIVGVPADTISRLAHELAASPAAAVYGRMGTTTSGLAVGGGRTLPLATVASWLVDVVNVLVGSLDRAGGVMFPLPPAGGPSTEGTPGIGRGATIPGRRRTRVRGLPSVFGEFPAAALAEEIDTETVEGTRVRALVTVAGNPVVSTPDGPRLEEALASLDLLVCLDAYVTETSRQADVILPAPSPLARRHVDVVFANLAIANSIRYSSPAMPLAAHERDEAETLMQLTAIVFAIASGGPEPSIADVDDLVAYTVAHQAVTDLGSRAHGRDVAEVLAAVAPRRGVDRILDLRLRSGPYGDGFGSNPGGLTLTAVQAAPHGIDLGPLTPRLPEVLRTASGRIELTPPVLVEALAAAADALAGIPAAPPLVLVGRRQLRSNNSWMHNLPTLAGGSNACTLQMHPRDAERAALQDGMDARVATATGSIVVPVEITDAVCEGVVCLPHGWGHAHPDAWGATARERAGANVNTIVGSADIDALSGTAVLAGMAVEVTPA